MFYQNIEYLIFKKKFYAAAHCVHEKYLPEPKKAKDLKLVFGAFNIDVKDESESYSVTPTKIIIHDDWNPSIKSFDADIALLITDEDILTSRLIKPVCLWESATTTLDAIEGFIAGWGTSHDSIENYRPLPKDLKVPIHDQLECFYDNPRLAEISSRRTFCGGSRNGKGPCHGDSGSGLFVLYNNVFYLKGIVSSSLIDDSQKCDVSNLAVYTNVLKYTKWIKDPEHYVDHSNTLINKLKLNDPSSSKCGQISYGSGLVQGGSASRKGQWPFAVAVYSEKEEEKNFICGGSLISSRHVLTGVFHYKFT